MPPAPNFRLCQLKQKISGKKSLTLVEIMVAMLILATSVTGLFAVFVSGKKLTARSRRRLVAFNFARQQAEKMRSAVRQDTYDDPAKPLFPGPHGTDFLTHPNPLDFPSNPATGNYVVGNVLIGSLNMRKATITIRWHEPEQ